MKAPQEATFSCMAGRRMEEPPKKTSFHGRGVVVGFSMVFVGFSMVFVGFSVVFVGFSIGLQSLLVV